MRRRVHQDDEDEDPDAPLESDRDPPDMLDVIDCPYCGRPISEMAEQCPKCGNYISHEEVSPTSQTKRLVTAIVIVLLLLAMVIGVLR